MIRNLYAGFVWEKEITIVRTAILLMADAEYKGWKMNIKSKNRISRLIVKKHRAVGLFMQSRYAVLAFVSLWLSAIFTRGSNQLIALAAIFGLKWIFEGLRQTIQIYIERG